MSKGCSAVLQQMVARPEAQPFFSPASQRSFEIVMRIRREGDLAGDAGHAGALLPHDNADTSSSNTT